MKRKLGIAVGLFLALSIGARCAIIFGLAARERVTSHSPNGVYVLEVARTYRGDFWGGAPHDMHEIRLFSHSGALLRRFSVDDRANRWPATCAIEWSAEQGAVVCVLKRENQEVGRVVLALRE
jgi:hypothetical protein